MAAKTRAWTMGGFTIEYWDFTEIFMVKYDIKYGKMMNSQDSIFVIELIQSQVTAFFCWFCDSTAIFDEFAASFSWYD